VICQAGTGVELALKVCFTGFVFGLVIFLVALSFLAPLTAVLIPRAPGYEPLVVLAAAGAVIAICLIDFYVLLPSLSLYTFRLVESHQTQPI